MNTKEKTPKLSLADAIGILVGIVVGTAIFKSSTLVFQNVAGPWQALGVWALGGGLCLIGALCYAQLATTYPRNGGDYEYLSLAYGRSVGFLFGWAQLAAILTGSIGAMAYVFADYAGQLWALPTSSGAWIAVVVVVVLSAANLFGLAVGKSLQNVLTLVKILGLAVVALAGWWWGRADAFAATAEAPEMMAPSLGLALVFVLYAYGGWNDAVFVTAEVRQPQRNLPRALFLGIAGVTVIYLAVNAAYLAVLGFDAARATPTPAADVLQRAVGPWGGKAVSVLVMISALGAINGMILAGARVYATVAEDHRAMRWLGRWNTRSATPVTALVAQAVMAIVLIGAVGTTLGRRLVDLALSGVGLPGLPWDDYFGGFETLVAGTAPVFWSFFLLTGISVVILRLRQPHRERPFSVPGYPIPVLIFCATCLYMLYSSLVYAKLLVLLGLVPLALGAPVYWMGAWRDRKSSGGK